MKTAAEQDNPLDISVAEDSNAALKRGRGRPRIHLLPDIEEEEEHIAENNNIEEEYNNEEENNSAEIEEEENAEESPVESEEEGIVNLR